MVGKDKIPKYPSKVKLVKLARLKLNQKKINSVMKKLAGKSGPGSRSRSEAQVLEGHDNYDNHDIDPDLEAPILTEGTEWVDVDVDDAEASSSLPKPSYAHVALPGNVRSVNPPSPSSWATDSPNLENLPNVFGSHALEHKAKVQPIFLAYSKVLAEGNHIPLVQVAAAVVRSMGNADTLDTIQPMKSG